MNLQYAARGVLTLYLFHLVRNITPVYFLVLGALLGVLLGLVAYCGRKVRFDFLVFVVFFFWIYASFITLFQSEAYGDSAVGLFRFWVSVPLVIVGMVCSMAPIRIPMRLVSLFFGFAALTFLWQYAFGAIYWFAESSERAGGDRFASLAGSLTAYGVFLGVPALAALVYFRGVSRLFLFGLLTMGAILSLQKAALANVSIALLAAVWLGVVRVRTFVGAVAMAMLVGVVILSVAPQEGVLGIVSRQSIGVLSSNSEITGDVSFIESVIDRLTDLPSEALAFYSPESLVLGVGVFGGAGALGYPDLPMAHNGLVEILLIFGLLFGWILIVFLIGLSIWSLVSLRKRSQVIGTEIGFLYAAYVIWFVNYVFSGGGLFHPIGASLLWLVVFRIHRLQCHIVN